MVRVWIRFYQRLNDFLPAGFRFSTLERTLCGRSSIKDMIESLGVPHPEVFFILVNGQPQNWEYIVRDQDRISVYPQFEWIDIQSVNAIAVPSLHEYRFVLDVHLGRLALLLRLAGFDSVYRNDFQDEELAKISHEQNRMLLTRDRMLLNRSIVSYGYYIRSTNPAEQFKEVVERFGLWHRMKPFQRCPACNGILISVNKDSIRNRLPGNTARYYNDFQECPDCRKVYWKGSHYRKVNAWIQKYSP